MLPWQPPPLRSESIAGCSSRRAELVSQPRLRAFPIWQRALELLASEGGELEVAFAAIGSLRGGDPAIFDERAQRARERGAVHAEERADAALRNGAGSVERLQQRELSQGEAGGAQLGVIKLA